MGVTGPRENALTHAPHVRGVWGSVCYLVSPVQSGGLGRLIPTKTSKFVTQSFGVFSWSCIIFFQVFLTLLIWLCFLLDFAVRRSMSILEFILFSHFDLIVFLGYVFPPITRSHLRDQIRWADSDSNILFSRIFPLCSVVVRSLLFVVRDPHPRMVPRHGSKMACCKNHRQGRLGDRALRVGGNRDSPISSV